MLDKSNPITITIKGLLTGVGCAYELTYSPSHGIAVDAGSMVGLAISDCFTTMPGDVHVVRHEEKPELYNFLARAMDKYMHEGPCLYRISSFQTRRERSWAEVVVPESLYDLMNEHERFRSKEGVQFDLSSKELVYYWYAANHTIHRFRSEHVPYGFCRLDASYEELRKLHDARTLRRGIEPRERATLLSAVYWRSPEIHGVNPRAKMPRHTPIDPHRAD